MDDRFQRLRHARTEKGFDTASAAADAFGWNRNTYASNENGNAPYSYRKAKLYAEAFGVRPEWLYDASGPIRAGGPGGQGGMVRVKGMVAPIRTEPSSSPPARKPGIWPQFPWRHGKRCGPAGQRPLHARPGR